MVGKFRTDTFLVVVRGDHHMTSDRSCLNPLVNAQYRLTLKDVRVQYSPCIKRTRVKDVRRFSAGAVNNLQIGGALTRIIYNGVLLSKF